MYYPNLKAEMARLGVSQKELAQRLNWSECKLSLILNGKRILKMRDAEAIKKALGITSNISVLFVKR